MQSYLEKLLLLLGEISKRPKVGSYASLSSAEKNHIQMLSNLDTGKSGRVDIHLVI